MTELGRFIVGDPAEQPADIDGLAKQHGGFRNVPVVFEQPGKTGVQTTSFTAESLMRGFCVGREPDQVSDEKFREILQNIASGKGHGG